MLAGSNEFQLVLAGEQRSLDLRLLEIEPDRRQLAIDLEEVATNANIHIETLRLAGRVNVGPLAGKIETNLRMPLCINLADWRCQNGLKRLVLLEQWVALVRGSTSCCQQANQPIDENTSAHRGDLYGNDSPLSYAITEGKYLKMQA